MLRTAWGFVKFALKYKFIKRETRGLKLRSRPLIPFLNPLTPTTLEVACNRAKALHAVCHQINLEQILKFHERVISTLKFELSDISEAKF